MMAYSTIRSCNKEHPLTRDQAMRRNEMHYASTITSRKIEIRRNKASPRTAVVSPRCQQTAFLLFAHLILLGLLLVAQSAPTLASSTSAKLVLTTDTTGEFSIRLVSGDDSSHGNSVIELHSAETRVGSCSSQDGTLLRVGPPIATDGMDAFGTYQGKTWSWACQKDPNTIRMETTIYSYPADDVGLLIFEQTFPKAVEASELTNHIHGLSSTTLFPTFQRNPGPSDALKTFSYHGVFPRIEYGNFSNYKESHQGGVPLVIYDRSKTGKDLLPMVVFSPLNWIKASHMASSPSNVGAGIKNTVNYIPKGWSQRFMLCAGRGINRGMMEWGDRMMKYNGIHGRQNPYRYRDAVHSTIGFWTDNGGYYHYNLGNVSRGLTYEDVLPMVKQYHDNIQVPFGHWQFDSWFYPKDGPVNKGGGGGAVVNWTALESVFPSGMAGIQAKLKLPMIMHNRQWSVQNDYMKNWPDIEWYTSTSNENSGLRGEKAAIPKNPLVFFTRFFTTMDKWGLSMYEQDWMCTQYDRCQALQTNISMGDLWLSGMARGAELSNRTVQYCMPYPNDVLSAVAYPAVTNARASQDYANFAVQQWSIASTSLFYWAIGILPFKDGFFSSSLPQIGGQTVGPEKNPDREIIMATLSCAMVGPMDGIHLLNKTRVLASCNGAGHILKPDRPITTPDYCYEQYDDPGDCEISATYSDIDGCGRIYYVFDNKTRREFVPAMIGLSASSPHIVYNWYTQSAHHMNSRVPLSPGYEGHSYAVVVPVLSNWAFLGEIDKYVTVSNVRFVRVFSNGNDSIAVMLKGVDQERVRVCAVAFTQDLSEIVCQIIKFSDGAGRETVVFPPPKNAEVLEF